MSTTDYSKSTITEQQSKLNNISKLLLLLTLSERCYHYVKVKTLKVIKNSYAAMVNSFKLLLISLIVSYMPVITFSNVQKLFQKNSLL